MPLQACVIEESCTFSALDKVRDITCVSLLALGIKDIGFKFHKTSQSKKMVKVLSHNDKIPLGKLHSVIDICSPIKSASKKINL